MPQRAHASVPDFAPVALAASRVGTWQRDPITGLVRCDAVMAQLFGVPVAIAEEGVPLSRFRDAILPEDQPLFDRKNEAISRRGGLIVVEYRVSPSPGVVRWILARGRYEPASALDQFVTGSGIVIDITDSKQDGHIEDEAFFARPSSEAEDGDTPLIRACDHALGLRREALTLVTEVPGLRELADVALLALGQRLAAETPLAELDEDGEQPVQPKRRRHS